MKKIIGFLAILIIVIVCGCEQTEKEVEIINETQNLTTTNYQKNSFEGVINNFILKHVSRMGDYSKEIFYIADINDNEGQLEVTLISNNNLPEIVSGDGELKGILFFNDYKVIIIDNIEPIGLNLYSSYKLIDIDSFEYNFNDDNYSYPYKDKYRVDENSIFYLIDEWEKNDNEIK